MNTTYPPRNIERIRAILDHISAYPDTWDQSRWHCGTTHCFAGHAQLAAGKKPNDSQALSDAREWLSLTYEEAAYYTDAYRTLTQLRELLEPLDADGFDRHGFDRNGRDRDGYDRIGYNSAGFDRAGYSRGGFNCNGFDRNGFDLNGYDRAGFDRNGFDRNGVRKS